MYSWASPELVRRQNCCQHDMSASQAQVLAPAACGHLLHCCHAAMFAVHLERRSTACRTHHTEQWIVGCVCCRASLCKGASLGDGKGISLARLDKRLCSGACVELLHSHQAPPYHGKRLCFFTYLLMVRVGGAYDGRWGQGRQQQQWQLRAAAYRPCRQCCCHLRQLRQQCCADSTSGAGAEQPGSSADGDQPARGKTGGGSHHRLPVSPTHWVCWNGVS